MQCEGANEAKEATGVENEGMRNESATGGIATADIKKRQNVKKEERKIKRSINEMGMRDPDELSVKGEDENDV